MNMKVFLVLNRIQLTVSLYHYPIFIDRFTNLKNEENSHVVKIYNDFFYMLRDAFLMLNRMPLTVFHYHPQIFWYRLRRLET